MKNGATSKRYLCASCLQLFGLILNMGRGPSWRNDAEEEVTMEPDMFSKAVALTTILSALVTVMRRDFRSLLLWFREMTSSPRTTFTLPPLFPLGTRIGRAGLWNAYSGLWGPSWLCEGEGVHLWPAGKISQIRTNELLGSSRLRVDRLGAQKFHHDCRGCKVSCWLVWGSPRLVCFFEADSVG